MPVASSGNVRRLFAIPVVLVHVAVNTTRKVLFKTPNVAQQSLGSPTSEIDPYGLVSTN
jgi:hypothetical protein